VIPVPAVRKCCGDFLTRLATGDLAAKSKSRSALQEKYKEVV